ncbi:MAG: zinc-dependent metalloprotease [Saprospiraceae bacterium]
MKNFSSLLFSSLLFSLPLLSQEPSFLTPVSLSNANFTTEESDLWDFNSQRPTTVSISLVSVGHVTADSVSVQMPGQSTNHIFRGYFLQKIDTSEYLWYGHSEIDGYFGIGVNTAGKVGFFQIDGTTYFLHPLSSRYCALVEQAPDEIEGEGSDCVHETLPSSEPPVECTSDETCAATVSVLVLVTREANAWIGNNTPSNSLSQLLYLPLGLQMVNAALRNSGLIGKQVRFIVEPFDFEFDISNNIFTDLNELSVNTTAFQLKADKSADLMVLLAHDRYTGAPGVFQQSSVNVSLPDFGIVSIAKLFPPRLTLAHELGHAFGANHDRATLGLPAGNPLNTHLGCSYGWAFAGGNYKTIMTGITQAQIAAGQRRALNYSNPNIQLFNDPTGTEYDYNARVIGHKICVVANYYDTPELTALIDGFNVICDDVTFSADVYAPSSGQCSGPFTYQWRIDDDPYWTLDDAGVLVGTGPTLSFNSYSVTLSEFYLHLAVFGQDNCHSTASLFIENPCHGFTGGGVGQKITSVQESNALRHGFRLRQNPVAHGLLELICTDPDMGATTVDCSITDQTGRVLQRATLNLSGGESTLRLPATLASGMYQITVYTEKQPQTIKFVIQN